MTATSITRRPRRVVDTAEFDGFVRRILRAYGRRVADGDIEALGSLVELAAEVDAAARFAVEGLRTHRHPFTWSEIAARLRVTAQVAQYRYTDHPAGSSEPVPSATYLQSLLDLLDGEVAS